MDGHDNKGKDNILDVSAIMVMTNKKNVHSDSENNSDYGSLLGLQVRNRVDSDNDSDGDSFWMGIITMKVNVLAINFDDTGTNNVGSSRSKLGPGCHFRIFELVPVPCVKSLLGLLLPLPF